MKKVAYIIFALYSICLYSQNKWELTHNVYGQHPIKIEVLDSNFVNILLSTGSNFKYIFNSTNQGKNWNLMYGTNVYLSEYDMSCPDTNSFYIGFRKSIYKSTNKGQDVEVIEIDTNAIYDVYHIEMLNQDIGVACYLSLLVTKDGWKTYKYEKYWKKNDSVSFSFSLPQFKNDSIINCIVGNSRGRRGSYFCEFNINSFEYVLNWIGIDIGLWDMSIIDKKNIFICGESDILSGGSSNDGIFKSSDTGKTWRRVLDFRSDRSKFNNQDFPPFGLQSIAFKDSLRGIAVGQFGKIVYTYDGGESWIYESKLHDSIYQPPTMKVRYVGNTPIVATYHGQIFRMIEDNLAPKPEDTITISGRVWEGTKGQPGIPIELGFRITMTDSNGFYKFTNVSSGKHIVKAKNKYHDGDLIEYYYKPFDYTPTQYDLDLTGDTSGIDFNAIDLRTFYSVSGKIITTDGNGLKDIPLTIGDSSTVSTEDGKFLFPKIEQKRTYELIPYSKIYKFTPWAYSINIDKDLDTFKFIASEITSVEELPNNQLIISDDSKLLTYLKDETLNCIFDSDINSNDFSISIYSINGVLLLNEQKKVVKGFNEFTINLTNFNTGIYLLNAYINGLLIAEKFVLVK